MASSPPFKQQKLESSFLGFTDATIVSLIINFLSFKELMTLTVVSPSINRLLSRSEIIPNRVKLSIDESIGKEKIFDFIDVAFTQRRYKTLEVKSHLKLREKCQITEAIKHFSETLEEIITIFDFDLPGVSLPNLKRLEMRIANGVYHEMGLLWCVNNLETLILSGPIIRKLKPSPPYPISTWVAVCLTVNENLKVLELEDQVAHAVIGNINKTEYEFQLKRFAVRIQHEETDILQSFYSNLTAFVTSQQDSLVDLKLMRIPLPRMLEIMTVMNKVERLTYTEGVLPCCEYGALFVHERLPATKLSVKELNLVCCPRFEGALSALLVHMPNVERVYFAICDDDIVREVYKHPSVVELKYAICDEKFLVKYQKFMKQVNEGERSAKRDNLLILTQI